MDLTYRVPGPWGPGKGTNLQPSEVDNNFWSLVQGIVDLQTNPAQPVGIASISMSGSQMTIYLTDGTVMGPFLIPVLTFSWRGEWQPDTSYAELDVVTVGNDGIFLNQIAHTSGTAFDPALQIPPGSGILVWHQLFGSAGTTLATLSDVRINEPPPDQDDVLVWQADEQKWVNLTLGDMAYQRSTAVNITGGAITGIAEPLAASDVATKAYVDALPAGMTIDDSRMMANISGTVGPALPQTLSDFLDHIFATTVVGTLLYRSTLGWNALDPGTAGHFLQTGGAGVDVAWAAGGAGVTSIAAGTGIAASPDPIVGSGTLSLAPVGNGNLLANTSGGSAAPLPMSLTQFLDAVAANARGSVLVRNSTGWVALAPGSNGQYLKTQGAGADLTWDNPTGTGTVTSISAGTGISTGGSPITGAGTVALATIADARLLANISGGSAAPTATTLTLLLDYILGTTQGAIVYRSGSAWVILSPGTSGQILTTGGAGANPAWANAPIAGAAIANQRMVANISGSTAVPIANTLTAIFDAILGSARASLIYRTATGWAALAPGTTGQVLGTGSASTDPAWVSVATTLDALSDVTVTSPQTYDALVYGVTAGQWTRTRPRYVIGCYTPGLMSANQNLLFHRVSKAITIPTNFGAYLGHASEAGGSAIATNPTTVVLARALNSAPTSFTNIGSISFTPGSANGNWSNQAAITLAQGDVIRVRGPATPDPSLADFYMTLVAFET